MLVVAATGRQACPVIQAIDMLRSDEGLRWTEWNAGTPTTLVWDGQDYIEERSWQWAKQATSREVLIRAFDHIVESVSRVLVGAFTDRD